VPETIANLLINGASPVTVGGTGTTAKFFPAVPGASIGVASTAVGYVYIPGNNAVNGQAMTVNVVGSYTLDATDASSPTVTVELVATTNPTAASPTYTVICTTGAVSTTGIGVASDSFKISASIFGDNVSGLVSGNYTAIMNGALKNTPPTILTNNLTSIVFSNAVPFALAVRVTFSVTGAKNSSSLYQFSLATS
jgi:hypothetical protein